MMGKKSLVLGIVMCKCMTSSTDGLLGSFSETWITHVWGSASGSGSVSPDSEKFHVSQLSGVTFLKGLTRECANFLASFTSQVFMHRSEPEPRDFVSWPGPFFFLFVFLCRASQTAFWFLLSFFFLRPETCDTRQDEFEQGDQDGCLPALAHWKGLSGCPPDISSLNKKRLCSGAAVEWGACRVIRKFDAESSLLPRRRQRKGAVFFGCLACEDRTQLTFELWLSLASSSMESSRTVSPNVFWCVVARQHVTTTLSLTLTSHITSRKSSLLFLTGNCTPKLKSCARLK